ncbi:B-cell receptor CD22 isoform X1 [Nannospalax galili]|uniref:B-cell receptor CD22 n=1 Tax=Nannospalax galili TaxID=1026970 RepID=A0A8C6RH04_NANGA|nr:B-cell receptor CD22 isoform X1 [Nannospalax galili]
MRVLCPWLLLILEYLALAAVKWIIEHPNTLYAWEGACIWIPCKYKILPNNERLKNVVLYQNYWYDNVTKDFMGITLYENTEFQAQYGRVAFLGDSKDNCTLKIHPIRVNDSGLVGLRMKTDKEKWMEEIHLNVSESPFPPYIRLPPEIKESQTVTLTCGLNFTCFGYHIQLQWSLKGPTVTSTSPFLTSVYTESKLTFQPQWTDHGKNVTCQVRNSTQVLSENTVRLDVKHTPKLTIEVYPKETAVMEMDSVTMTCQVTSSNPEYKTVSWFKDGNILNGQTMLTLTLPEVTKAMSGRYHCQASNEEGQGKSEEVTLTVLFPPEPSKVQIPHSPAEEGKSIELICISLASPKATNYTWYHNGKEMPGSTQEKLHIPKVFLWHAGNYSCLAENSLGSGQIGEEVELDVQYAPMNVTTVIQNSTPIREGDSVTLLCSYTSSNPAVTRYEWSVSGSRNEPTPGRVLKIQKVAWNAIPIRCAACNRWCSWATPVNLNVHYAPRDVNVLTISHQSEIHAGQHVLLQCNFSASHPKEVHFFWKKNGSFMQEGRDLNFNSISPEDAGNYNCVVNNSIGQTSSQDSRLQVLYPPRRLRVSISPGDRVMEGKKATLTCESEANPPVLQYTWFDQNDQDLYYPGQKLKLEPLKIQHSGSYRCQGTNKLGTGMSPPSTLTVYYSPETIGKRVALGLGFFLAIFILTTWGVKLQRKWKRTQSQQGLQENSSAQSFFVRNKKARRTPLSERPQSLGCYNPVMDDSVNYSILRFPETDTPTAGDARTSATQGPLPNNDTVTYSVLQKRQMGDYENVTPNSPEDEGIHYSELVRFGAGERPQVKENVEYVTLKQ